MQNIIIVNDLRRSARDAVSSHELLNWVALDLIHVLLASISNYYYLALPLLSSRNAHFIPPVFSNRDHPFCKRNLFLHLRTDL
jgi:hypothetical protein